MTDHRFDDGSERAPHRFDDGSERAPHRFDDRSELATDLPYDGPDT